MTGKDISHLPADEQNRIHRRRAADRAWHHKNKERRNGKRRERYAVNPEPQRTRSKAWATENPEENARRAKAWRVANPERDAANHADWSKRNKEKRRVHRKRWRSKNPNYHRDKYASDIQYKLSVLVRTRVNSSLRRFERGTRAGSAVRDLGCTIDELRIHLESQFTPEMSWENHGSVWEIDHILPLASFDLTDRDQFLVACHYTNLQPLLVEDNRAKSDKLPL